MTSKIEKQPLLERTATDDDSEVDSGWSWLQRLRRGNPEAGSYLLLLSPQLLRTTLLLWVLWFACSLIYYGVVLSTPRLLSSGHVPAVYLQENSFYANVMITTVAEIPGVLVACLLIDWLGRKLTAVLFFLCTGVGQLLFLVTQQATAYYLTLGTVSRAAIMGAYSIVYTYTPEVYPSTLRGVGIGTAFAASKIASIITPYIGGFLIKYSDAIPIVVYGVTSIVAALCVVCLPLETKNRSLVNSLVDDRQPATV